MINYDDFPPLMTVAEMRQLLRIGKGKAYDMIRDKEVPAIKLRGEFRIPRDTLLQMLHQQIQQEQQEIPNAGTKLHPVPTAKEDRKI